MRVINGGKVVSENERMLDADKTDRWSRVEDVWGGWDSEMSSPEGKRDASLASQVISEFGQGDIRDWLRDTGFGKNPSLIRTLAAIQRELAELRAR